MPDFDDIEKSAQLSLRLPIAVSAGILTGFFMGVSHGSTMAGLRFRAEHTHRLPTSQTGWYLYHKSKNYQVMYEGLKVGFKTAFRIGGWTGLFFGFEQILQQSRKKTDAFNTIVAGLSTGGCFSALNRLPLNTAARTTRIGLYAGLAIGLSQDLLRAAQGQPPWYIERLRITRRKSDESRGTVARGLCT
jgi:hypothetical protein